ncbi:MAG: TatD family hydrolase [Armatimonadetes bacterium]|nr:TatD family hydrolase [Armatimonadota bacterium]
MLVDTHCHLNHPDFAQDAPAVLARARQAGVQALVVIGYDLPSSEAALRLAESEPDVFAAVGLHPHEAEAWSAARAAQLGEMAARPRVVAIGECGLDFYRELAPRAAQYAAFHAQLQLAGEMGLPVVIHTRNSVAEALDITAPYAARGVHGVFHCWSGGAEEARRAVDLGFCLGIGGVVTFKNARDLHAIAAQAPGDRLVLETDAPYLAPTPHRGRRNEPAYLTLVAARVAELRGTPVATLAAATTANAGRLFPRLPRKLSGPAPPRSLKGGGGTGA